MAIKKIHSYGLLHCDLHTANILTYQMRRGFDIEYRASVIDFGVCASANSTDDSEVCGVIPFVAPEVLSKAIDMELGKADKTGNVITREAEWYSFGMIAYEVLTGRLPFAGYEHDAGLISAICSGARPEFPDGVPSSIAKEIRRYWDPNPAKRPNSFWISNRREIRDGVGYGFNDLKTPLPQPPTNNYNTNYTSRLIISSSETEKSFKYVSEDINFDI